LIVSITEENSKISSDSVASVHVSFLESSICKWFGLILNQYFVKKILNRLYLLLLQVCSLALNIFLSFLCGPITSLLAFKYFRIF
jgi:hypothetical protein